MVPTSSSHLLGASRRSGAAPHPAGGAVGLVCDFHPDSYVRGEQAAAFLHRVPAGHPSGPADVAWDNPQANEAPAVREAVGADPRMTPHYLPPYAAGPNAAEGTRSLTKYHRMANRTTGDLDALHAEARRHPPDVGDDPDLLRPCPAGAELALSLPTAQ